MHQPRLPCLHFFFWLLAFSCFQTQGGKRMESVVCRIHVTKVKAHYILIELELVKCLIYLCWLSIVNGFIEVIVEQLKDGSDTKLI